MNPLSLCLLAYNMEKKQKQESMAAWKSGETKKTSLSKYFYCLSCFHLNNYIPAPHAENKTCLVDFWSLTFTLYDLTEIDSRKDDYSVLELINTTRNRETYYLISNSFFYWEIWDGCPRMLWSQSHLCLLSFPLFYCIPLLSSWQCLSSECAGSLSLERCSGSNGVNRSVRKFVPFSISLSLPVALQSFVCVWWEECGTTKTGRLHLYEGRGCGSNSSSCQVLRKG